MLDIGWSEMLVIAVILIVVVGPKDLPPMLRAFGKMTTKLRRTAGEFRAQFDEALREAELEDVGKTISDVRKFNPGSVVREAMKPLQEAGESIRSDIGKATAATTAAATSTDQVKSAPLPEMPSPLPPLASDLVQQADPAPAKPKRAAAAKPSRSKAASAAPIAAEKTPAAKPKAGKPASAARKASVGKPKAAKTVEAAQPKVAAGRKTTKTTKDKA